MKILFLDIETAPALGYFYARYDQNISPDQIVHNGFMMCFQYAWNDGPVKERSLRKKKHPLPKDDKQLVLEVAKLIGEADVVVAHNAIRFDLAYISARLAAHDKKPFAPPYVVDTLRVCKRYFKFESNSLDSVCQQLGLGRKFHSGGFENCIKALHGDQTAWNKLLIYGKHDVKLLRDLYYRVRPWMKDHPNYNLFDPKKSSCCPNCKSKNFISNGHRITQTMKYRRFQCLDCGAWFRERVNSIPRDKRKLILAGA
jgi:DNA polymerase elongation subunit (family B)